MREIRMRASERVSYSAFIAGDDSTQYQGYCSHVEKLLGYQVRTAHFNGLAMSMASR